MEGVGGGGIAARVQVMAVPEAAITYTLRTELAPGKPWDSAAGPHTGA